MTKLREMFAFRIIIIIIIIIIITWLHFTCKIHLSIN